MRKVEALKELQWEDSIKMEEIKRGWGDALRALFHRLADEIIPYAKHIALNNNEWPSVLLYFMPKHPCYSLAHIQV